MSLEPYVKQKPGKKSADIFLYALSTCGWCRKTKMLLDKHEVEYRYVDVDSLEGDAKQEALKEVSQYNPGRTFPTLVVNSDVIVGYKEEEIEKVLADAERERTG